jgi:gluconate kinase
MTNITILFGEMGAGKNYWGELLAKEENATFFDGDTVATEEMRDRVAKFYPLNKQIIEEYINVLLAAIVMKADDLGNLVVAQALYNNDDRLFIEEMLRGEGFKVYFVWIQTSFWRNLKQLYSRPRGFWWVIYWLMNKPYFEKPTHRCRML